MRASPQRLVQLQRLNRVRLVEIRVARRRLAEAIAESDRIERLHRRSVDLVATMAAGEHDDTGSSLRTKLALRSEVMRLARSSEDMLETAASAVAAMAQTSAEAERRSKHAAEALSGEMRRRRNHADRRAELGTAVASLPGKGRDKGARQ